jgi:hypothetical protein
MSAARSSPGPRPIRAPRAVAALALGLALSAVLAVSSCGRRERAPQWTSVPYVGQGDSLINALRPRLVQWLALWHQADPDFVLDSLARGERVRFQPERSMPVARAPGRAAASLSQPSPDSARLLLPDSYIEVVRSRRGIDLYREPDSAPAVVDLATGTQHVLFTYGTLNRFDDGFWIDASRFALWGWAQTGNEPPRWAGTLAVYDLGDSTEVTYLTSPVDEAARQRYDEAWLAWKLRGLRQGPS